MKTLIETIVESTIDWLDFFDQYGYDNADEDDIRTALAYDQKELLARLDKLSKTEYDQIIIETLDALQIVSELA